MKNKVKLKRAIIFCLVLMIVFNIVFLIMNYCQYKIYTRNFNYKINRILEEVIKECPNIDKNNLVEILNNERVTENYFLKEYGIDLNEDSLVLENDIYFNEFVIQNMVMISVLSLAVMFIFLSYNNSKDKELHEITKYIQEINKRNYKLDIGDNTEDELSILKNEIYKTTVMLKEVAENSIQDKSNLKESLSDISHQLKTPITSIIIMLDNILETENMDEHTRKDFIRNIKREIINIRFLVETILKLSKIDTNTVNFIIKEEYISSILDEVKKNVSVLCDLKDIEIVVDGAKTAKVNCDFKWQVEALTNILKNCIEHSNENSKVYINYEENNVYSKITIQDTGSGIDEEDLPHIFERFYKGKNSSPESVGIGLALAKSIIENNNGYIGVDSIKGKGSTFTIKYLK